MAPATTYFAAALCAALGVHAQTPTPTSTTIALNNSLSQYIWGVIGYGQLFQVNDANNANYLYRVVSWVNVTQIDSTGGRTAIYRTGTFDQWSYVSDPIGCSSAGGYRLAALYSNGDGPCPNGQNRATKLMVYCSAAGSSATMDGIVTETVSRRAAGHRLPPEVAHASAAERRWPH